LKRQPERPEECHERIRQPDGWNTATSQWAVVWRQTAQLFWDGAAILKNFARASTHITKYSV
jgi:hypothetical protein